MAILSKLFLYPIKSCAGFAVSEATLTPAGLAAEGVHDREWMLVTADGQFMSQREFPRMALIAPRVNDRVLQVTVPGMAPLALGLEHDAAAPVRQVQIWDDSVA